MHFARQSAVQRRAKQDGIVDRRLGATKALVAGGRLHRLARLASVGVLVLAAVLASIATTPTSANAQLKPVVTVGVGTALARLNVDGNQAKWDPGYDIGGALGIQLGDYVRWDVFDGHFAKAGQTNVVDEVTLSTAALVSSFKVGLFGENLPAWPYFSAGFGATNVGLKSGGVKETDWGFSYDVGAGMEGPIGDSGAAVGLRYRFRATELDLPVKTRAFVHAINLELLFIGLP